MKAEVYYWILPCRKIVPIDVHGGAHGIIVIVIVNGPDNPSSIPKQSCLHFTLC